MSEKVKVVIPPEKMAEIKEKYGLTDDALRDVLGGVHVVPVEGPAEQPQAGVTRTAQGEEETMPQLFRRISSGEFTMVDYLLYSDMQDRRESRRRREEKEEKPQTTAKEIGDEVVRGLKEAGALPAKPKTEEEMPSWAKKMQDDQELILNRLAKDEEEKRLKETVAAAVKPVQDELTRTKEEIAKTQKTLETKEPPKSELDKYIESKDKLEKAGIIREPGAEIPSGTPGEVTLAVKTLDKGEKVMTKGMDDAKEMMSDFMDFQLTREKRQFQQQAPPVKEFSAAEKEATLREAAEEPPAPQSPQKGGK